MSKRKNFLGCLMLTTLLSVGACKTTPTDTDKDKPDIEEESKYTITWVNFDGTVLEVDENVAKGSTPTFDSGTPRKDNSEQYSFTFKGWDKEVKAASENVTYKAEFNSTLIKAKIVFDLDGGSSPSKVDFKYVSEIKNSEFFFDVTKTGNKFVGWSYNGTLIFDKDGNKVTNVDIEIAETMCFKAVFDDSVTLTINNANEAFGSVRGAGTYSYGQTFNVSATARDGYVFVGWFDANDTLVSSNKNYSSKLLGDLVLVAKFKEVSKTLTITSYNENVGLVSFKGSAFAKSGTKEVDANETITVVAQAAAEIAQKANFLGWYNGNTKVSSSLEYTFSMPRYDYDLVAKWDIYTLTLATNNTEFGTVGESRKANIGENVTLEATAKTGYKFAGWYNGDEKVSEEATYVFEMPSNDVTLTAKFEIEEYHVGVQIVDNIGGSVQGRGTYQSGSTVTLVGTSENGFAFDGWYEEIEGQEVKVCSDLTYSFEMGHKDRDLYAKWNAKIYNLTATCNEERGFVEGGGKYGCTSIVTLTATPYVGYSFSAWVDENGFTVSENPTYKLHMPARNAEYKATFGVNSYKVTLTNANEDKGSIAGGGTFKFNTSATVTATPNDGYIFIGWYDGEELISKDAEYTFTVPAKDLNLTAKFDIESYAVNAVSDSEQKGTVTGAGRYQPGANVTLAATANTGYTFDGWYSGNTKVYSELTFQFEMGEEDVSYVAKFNANVHNVIIDYDSNKGSVSGNGSHYYGEKFNLIANPNTGYEFVAWKDADDKEISNISIYVPTMGDSDLHLKAEFRAIKYDVTVTSEDEEMGTVSGTGNYDFNSSVTAVATPEDGYMFIGWYNGDEKVSEDASYTFDVPANAVNLVAKFMPDNHREVLASSEDAKKGTVSGSGTYVIGEEATVVATANTGYTFEGWYNGDEKVSSSSEYKFTIPDGNTTLVAKFTINVHSVSVSCDGDMGTVTGEGDYEYASEVTINATAKQGYVFDHWENAAGDEFSEYAECMFGMVDEDLELTAVFVQRKYKINATSEDETMGTVTGGGEYYHGESVTMVASANVGYKFLGWYDEKGTKVTDNLSYSIDVDYADEDYIAKFKLDNERELIVVSENENKGTVAGGRIYKIGDEVTIEATSEFGYHFVGWFDGDELVSTEWQYTFTMPDREFKLVAKFEGNVHTVSVSYNDEGCSVTGTGEYHFGDTVTLVCECNDGYYFSEWANASDDKTLSNNSTYTFTLGDEDYNVEALIEKETVFYELTLLVSNEETGKVVDETGWGTYAYEDSVEISATPNDGYIFVGWYDGDELVSTDDYYIFEMPDGPLTLTAVFRSSSYNINISSDDEDMGSVSGDTSCAPGEKATVVATPKEEFEFIGWYSDDELVSEEATYEFDMPEADVSLVAKFKSLRYNIMINSGDEEKGTVSGDINCLAGEKTTVVATPKEGCHFVGWFEEGELVSEEATYEFDMPKKDVILEARFEINAYQVNVTCLYEIDGLYTFEGLYSYGDTVTLSFDSDKVPVNLEFSCWKIGEETIYEESTEITVENDMEIELVFVEY